MCKSLSKCIILQVKDMRMAIENIIKLKAETKLEITQLTGMLFAYIP